MHSADVVIIAGNFNAQLDHLVETEQRIGFPISAPADRIDKSDHLILVCLQHRLSLMNNNARHRDRHQLTWHSPSPSQSQNDHTAINHRRCGPIEDHQSFWVTPVNSDNALIRARFRLHLVSDHTSMKIKRHRQLILDDNSEIQLQSELLVRFSSQRNVQDSSGQRKQTKRTLHSVAAATQHSMICKPYKSSIYSTSANLFDAPRSVPPKCQI